MLPRSDIERNWRVDGIVTGPRYLVCTFEQPYEIGQRFGELLPTAGISL